MVSGISLANKCQLLFGAAVVVIVAAALLVPWIQTPQTVREGQFEVARQLAEAWLTSEIHLGQLQQRSGYTFRADALSSDEDQQALWITLVTVDELDPTDELDDFIARAIRKAQSRDDVSEHAAMMTIDGREVYRYARFIRESQRRAIRDPAVAEFTGGAFAPDVADPLWAMLIIDRHSVLAAGQLLRSRVFIIAAGIAASLMAMVVFYLILTKLILSPVRTLRETTEKVQAGDLAIRSQIKTGDEFEQLSEAFNTMLDRVEQSQAQLRAMNEGLDLKLTELAEANIGLYESNRLKSEFVASVSHELRTPLNSIIGFTELLVELAQSEPDADPKRTRYLNNILTSGRSLLEMINELLDMAKIEAGRMEVNVEPTSVGDLIEGLVAIMRPQAQTKRIELETKVSRHVPMIETDPGKLQQILYNFLSNAVKFTPDEGTVTISAERVTTQDNTMGVRISVADTGPGIPEDMQDVIFEKFRQIDASHTRAHAGTGLGLAICRELAEMLGASVSFTSEPQRGATFFVDLPINHQPDEPKPLMV
jgi:two-component system sensor histidine kinase BarA